jgi:hypothetical protein
MKTFSSGEQVIRGFYHAAELGNASSLSSFFKFTTFGRPHKALSDRAFEGCLQAIKQPTVNFERAFEVNHVVHGYAPLLSVDADGRFRVNGGLAGKISRGS